MWYLWFKFLHIFFMFAWFAGLFYLPRIYVNLAAAKKDSEEYARLLGMSNRLYRFVTPFAFLALLFGLAIIVYMQWWTGQGWVHAKITIGVVLAAYHFWCYRLLLSFREGKNHRSHVWFRFFNEVPVLMMLAALYLVIFKPF